MNNTEKQRIDLNSPNMDEMNKESCLTRPPICKDNTIAIKEIHQTRPFDSGHTTVHYTSVLSIDAMGIKNNLNMVEPLLPRYMRKFAFALRGRDEKRRNTQSEECAQRNVILT